MMKRIPTVMLAAATMIMSGCNGNNNSNQQKTMSNISEETVNRTVQAIVEKCPQADQALGGRH